MRPWRVLNSRYLIRRPWLNLREDRVLLPSGVELPEFHVLEYPDWACIVCIADSGELVLVEQYRHGLGQGSLEFPAGAVEGDEDPLQAAQRELREETGYAAAEWTFLGRCAPDPSRHTNYTYIYLARGAHRIDEQQLDRGEEIAVRLANPAEVLARAGTGTLIHGIHLLALFWAAQKGLIGPDR